MSRIKYMGSADIRTIEKGETFSGRLADPVSKELRWDKNNNFIIDTDDEGLSEEAVSLLLTDDNFKDVTDMKRIPTNLNEQIFGGLPADEPIAGEGDAVQTEAVSGEKSGSAPVGGGTAGGRGRTTAGGSTAGGGTTAGGSTGGTA